MLLEIKYLRIIIVLLGLSYKQAIVAQEGSYEISVPRLQESVKIDGFLNEDFSSLFGAAELIFKGWHNEAIPFSRRKKAVISGFFERFFSI